MVGNSYNERQYRRKEYESRSAIGLRYIVLRHYSLPSLHPCCAFPGCEETRLEELTLDHISGGGNKEAMLVAQGKTFPNLYQYLIRENFPSGYQTLCKFHNFGKPKVNWEEREAREAEEYARTHPTLWVPDFNYENRIPDAREQQLWREGV